MSDVPNMASELLAGIDRETAAIAEAIEHRPLSVDARASAPPELAKRIAAHNANVATWRAGREAVKATISKVADLDAKASAIIDTAAKVQALRYDSLTTLAGLIESRGVLATSLAEATAAEVEAAGRELATAQAKTRAALERAGLGINAQAAKGDPKAAERAFVYRINEAEPVKAAAERLRQVQAVIAGLRALAAATKRDGQAIDEYRAKAWRTILAG